MACPHHSLYRISSGVVAPSPRGSTPSAAGLDEEDGTEAASGDRGYSGASSGSGSAISRVPPAGTGARQGRSTGVAAGALSVLAAAVEHLGPQEAPAWAINAAGERMSRVLQAPHCPPDVRAAAGYAMGRLQQMGPGK